MTSETTPKDTEISRWDVALAALALQEFHSRGAPLGLQDFHRLARQYAIRLDDIMITLFELAIAGEWIYQDAEGQDQAMDRAGLDELYINGRLHDKDLQAFTGHWRPAAGA